MRGKAHIAFLLTAMTGTSLRHRRVQRDEMDVGEGEEQRYTRIAVFPAKNKATPRLFLNGNDGH